MAATAEMLAAQAQGGSAGVQAYLAAQQEITNRQQATIAQMQADAVSRHAPQEAITARTGVGTDALLNQLAVLQSNAGAEDSARSARMDDYSRQAAMAGGLIPLQAQADANLVRARGETDIARINAQGRNQLEEQRLTFAQRQAAAEQERRDQVEYIKWQMRSDEKKASADAAAKAAKENTLSADELEAMATLRARQSLATTAAQARQTLDSTPRPPAARATKQANGSFVLDPSILKPAQSRPTAAQMKEYEQVTGRKAPSNITLAEVRKVTGGVTPPAEVRRNQTLQRAPQQARSAERNRAFGAAQTSSRNLGDPIVMRDEVQRQAMALQDEGYVVTPEVMARLLNQPYLAANQYDARDMGLPYTRSDLEAEGRRAETDNEKALEGAKAQDMARIAKDFAAAFSSDVVPESVRGLQFDAEGLMRAADTDFETVAEFLDNNPFLPAQIEEFTRIVDDTDLEDAEREKQIRENFPNPAHRRILSYIILGK